MSCSNFDSHRIHIFRSFWESYLDDIDPEEKRLQIKAFTSLGISYESWIKARRNDVIAYIDASEKKRNTHKAWQKERFLLAYARWTVLCRGFVIYEWLKTFSPEYLSYDTDTLVSLYIRCEHLKNALSNLPDVPRGDYPEPF